MANAYCHIMYGWYVECCELKKWVKEELGKDDLKWHEFICYIDDYKKILHSGGDEFVVEIKYTSSNDPEENEDDYNFMFGITGPNIKFDRSFLLEIFDFMETELYEKEVKSFAIKIGASDEEAAIIGDAGNFD
jgi:hypothetical protein